MGTDNEYSTITVTNNRQPSSLPIYLIHHLSSHPLTSTLPLLRLPSYIILTFFFKTFLLLFTTNTLHPLPLTQLFLSPSPPETTTTPTLFIMPPAEKKWDANAERDLCVAVIMGAQDGDRMRYNWPKVHSAMEALGYSFTKDAIS